MSKKNSKIVGNMLIAQSGGPTVVINQSLVGAVLEAKKHKEIKKIYGALHGIKGILNEDLIDLGAKASPRSRPSPRRPRRPRLRPQEAHARGLREDLREAPEVRRALFLLHRRQRLGRNHAHHQRRGQAGRLRDALLPHPQDGGQRPARERPHAGLGQQRQVRGAGFHGRRSRQRRAAGREDQRGHGPARRLPHRGRRAGAHLSRRRSAPDIPARAALRSSTVPAAVKPSSRSTAAASCRLRRRFGHHRHGHRRRVHEEVDSHGNVQLSVPAPWATPWPT